MSQCSHAFAWETNRRKNRAAVIDPAIPDEETLLMSATFESSN
jgi:hypothetical protein